MKLDTSIGRHGGSLVPVAAAIALLCLAVRAGAAPMDDGRPSAVDLVRASIARVQQVVRVDSADRSESRRAEIREIAESLFDFEAMSRRVLARHWSETSPVQQEEFVRLFTNLLVRTYVHVIDSGVSLRATIDGESIEGSYARVGTRMGGEGGPEVSIEYRLFQHSERWAAYDVVYEGASLVANYRSQSVRFFGTRPSRSFWSGREVTSARPGVTPRRPTLSRGASCCSPS